MPARNSPSPDDLILRFERRDGQPVRVRQIATDAVEASAVPESAAIPPPAKAVEPPEPDRPVYSPDFATVRWNGVTFYLSGKQRPVFSVLNQALMDEVPCVTESLLLEEAGSVGSRIDALFKAKKNGPPWHLLICRGSLHGGKPGTYRITPKIKTPNPKENDQ